LGAIGADQPFGSEGICPGGMLHVSQDRIMLWTLKIKKHIEDWRQIQYSKFRLIFQEAII